MVALIHGSPFAYDDLQRMPDDGHRYELLDGSLLVTPAPGTAHQVCVSALVELLRHHRRPGDVVLTAPFDDVVSPSTVLEPDVLVARREDLGTANVPATPLLVVEVLSPSTRTVDRTAKRLAYEEAGCPPTGSSTQTGPASLWSNWSTAASRSRPSSPARNRSRHRHPSPSPSLLPACSTT